MPVGEGSGVYKPKPGRVKDKVRKAWKKISGGDHGPFGSAGGGSTGTTSPLGADSTVPYKKPPPRKGRPDGA